MGCTNLTDVAVLRIALTGSSSPVPVLSTHVIVQASTIVGDVHSCSPIFTANVNGVCNSQVVNKVENKGSNFHFSTGFSSKQASSFPPPKVKFLQRLKFQLRFWLNCKQATFTDEITSRNRRFMTARSQFMVKPTFYFVVEHSPSCSRNSGNSKPEF